MQRRVVSQVALIVFLSIVMLSGLASGDPFAVVRYQLFHWETDSWIEYLPSDPLPAGGDQAGTNLWKYDYVVYNWGTPQPIQQVYMFFNSDNVAMDATWTGDAVPTGWLTAQVGPFEPDFNWKERFMASGSAYYVDTLDSLEGLSVEFTWTKPMLPGNQIYVAVFGGGSESGLTIHETAPTAVGTTSWGAIKRLYR